MNYLLSADTTLLVVSLLAISTGLILVFRRGERRGQAIQKQKAFRKRLRENR